MSKYTSLTFGLLKKIIINIDLLMTYKIKIFTIFVYLLIP